MQVLVARPVGHLIGRGVPGDLHRLHHMQHTLLYMPLLPHPQDLSCLHTIFQACILGSQE